MSVQEAVSYGLALLQLIGLIVGGVWGISKIQSTTLVLNTTLQHLDETVKEIKGVISRMEDRLTLHDARLTKLEVVMDSSIRHHRQTPAREGT